MSVGSDDDLLHSPSLSTRARVIAPTRDEGGVMIRTGRVVCLGCRWCSLPVLAVTLMPADNGAIPTSTPPAPPDGGRDGGGDASSDASSGAAEQ
jgi:hypothetical protein